MTEQSPLSSRLQKTQMCRFHLIGACKKGVSCSHAHFQHELQEKPNLYKTSMCRQWLSSGECAREENCPYAHGATDLSFEEKIDSPKVLSKTPLAPNSSRMRCRTAETVHSESSPCESREGFSSYLPDSCMYWGSVPAPLFYLSTKVCPYDDSDSSPMNYMD